MFSQPQIVLRDLHGAEWENSFWKQVAAELPFG